LITGTLGTRVALLDEAVGAAIGHGYPVWVGGASASVGAVAARADGWNRWGPTLERFEQEAAAIREMRTRHPFTMSWAGMFVLDTDERAAEAKARRLGHNTEAVVGGPERVADVLRAYGAAGADWVIVGPVDSSDADNAALLGELVKPLLQ
jgi:alkanesulfonate monooxygenase SsuD/methylene tetrahydromethanopterin reductase-like flavin-dependent oxidoreductase (luciferase family)